MLSSRADKLGIKATKNRVDSLGKNAPQVTKNASKSEELQKNLTGCFSSSFAPKANITHTGFAKVTTVLQKSF